MSVLCMQPIKLRLKDHCVTAVMCQIRTDHDKTLIRQSAMQKRTSLFALMFAEDGTLLNANQAALRKFGPDCLGMTCSVCCLGRHANMGFMLHGQQQMYVHLNLPEQHPLLLYMTPPLS